jgi:Spy/CpxP family protein refolding chaperone
MNIRKFAPTAIIAAFATMIVGAQTQPAWAVPSTPMIDKGFEEALIKHFSNRFYNRIDATDEQRQKLSGILNKRAAETRPLREQVRVEASKLSDMMADDKVTDEQILTESQLLKGMRDKLMDERVQSALQVRAVLTSAQRAQISDRINGFLTGQWKSRLAR